MEWGLFIKRTGLGDFNQTVVCFLDKNISNTSSLLEGTLEVIAGLEGYVSRSDGYRGYNLPKERKRGDRMNSR